MTDQMIIEPADPESDDARHLLDRLEAELGARYGDDGKTDFTPDQVRVPGGIFLVAYLNGVAVGCGAVRPMEPGVGEVKRMFVEPHARKRGIAGMILADLEVRSRLFGYRTLRLETGIRQPEAIRIYERGGYRRIERYGKYVDNAESVCFEKTV